MNLSRTPRPYSFCSWKRRNHFVGASLLDGWCPRHNWLQDNIIEGRTASVQNWPLATDTLRLSSGVRTIELDDGPNIGRKPKKRCTMKTPCKAKDYGYTIISPLRVLHLPHPVRRSCQNTLVPICDAIVMQTAARTTPVAPGPPPRRGCVYVKVHGMIVPGWAT